MKSGVMEFWILDSGFWIDSEMCFGREEAQEARKEGGGRFFYYPQITQMDTDVRGAWVESVEICVICG